MSGPTWYKRNARRALRGMAKLTLEQRGFYQTLQDMIYDEGGPIEDDERHIAGQMMVSIRKYRAMRDELLELGRIVRSDDGKLFDEACAEVLSEYDEKHEARVVAGRKGGVASSASRAKNSRKRAENELKTSRKSSENGADASENNHLAEAMLPKKTEYKILDDEMSARASVVQISTATPDVIWQRRKLEFIALMAGQLNMTAGCFTQTTKLKNLCEPATGPPCDWERDVVPAAEVVRDRFAARGELIFSWTPIVNEILRHRDQRLAGNPQAVIDQTGETYVKRGAFADARNNPRAQRNARHRAALEVLDESGRLAPLVKRASAD